MLNTKTALRFHTNEEASASPDSSPGDSPNSFAPSAPDIGSGRSAPIPVSDAPLAASSALHSATDSGAHSGGSATAAENNGKSEPSGAAQAPAAAAHPLSSPRSISAVILSLERLMTLYDACLMAGTVLLTGICSQCASWT